MDKMTTMEKCKQGRRLSFDLFMATGGQDLWLYGLSASFRDTMSAMKNKGIEDINDDQMQR